jgi:hypothetical protein
MGGTMVQADLENATREANSSAGDHFGWNMGSVRDLPVSFNRLPSRFENDLFSLLRIMK